MILIEKILEGLEIRRRIETIKTTAVKSARTLRNSLRESARDSAENLAKSNIMITLACDVFKFEYITADFKVVYHAESK